MQKGFGIGTVVMLAAVSAAWAQYPDAGQGSWSGGASQAAPVVQGYPSAQAYPQRNAENAGGYGAGPRTASQVFDQQPNAGVSVRGDVSGGVETVTATNLMTELRVTQGRADVTVHRPTDHSEILVDLPNGQVSLLKDGLYTFNAGTNTVRVLHGEAEAFNTPREGAKGTKVKETQELALIDNVKLKAINAYPYELTADLVGGGGRHGDGANGDGAYGEGFYGGYPGYAYGYGYPYGFYPYGYGYPFGVGLGFGYYGGFGGFRGGGFRR